MLGRRGEDRAEQSRAEGSGHQKDCRGPAAHLQLQRSLLTLQHLLDLHRLLVEMFNSVLVAVDLLLQSRTSQTCFQFLLKKRKRS